MVIRTGDVMIWIRPHTWCVRIGDRWAVKPRTGTLVIEPRAQAEVAYPVAGAMVFTRRCVPGMLLSEIGTVYTIWT